MQLIDRLATYSGAALCDSQSGRMVDYRELSDAAASVKSSIESEMKRLVFCLVDLSIGAVQAYLGALSANHCVCLIDAGLAESIRDSLVNAYQPDWIIAASRDNGFGDAYHRGHAVDGTEVWLWQRKKPASVAIHRDNQLLLPTSGSTGNPKMVRLSGQNIDANALSIAEYLDLQPDDRPISSLPLQYSYGLSVLNSHLMTGGCLILTNHSIIESEFWDTFRDSQCTSFAGVPFQYTSLLRTGFEKLELPTLRTMTQAGGKLADRVILKFHQWSLEKDFRFFVMFGQTEATARISYLDPDALPTKLGSVGHAIGQGRLSLEDSDGVECNRGEVVYRGPNVSQGYATNRSELVQGDCLEGVLRTGDIGYFDDDGFLFLTGREGRFAKVFGLRLSLADIESALDADVVAIASHESVIVVHDANLADASTARKSLSSRFRIHQSAFKMQCLDPIPLTANGKPNIAALKEMFGGT